MNSKSTCKSEQCP